MTRAVVWNPVAVFHFLDPGPLALHPSQSPAPLIIIHIELETLIFKTEHENNQSLKNKMYKQNVSDSEMKKLIHISPEFNDDPHKILLKDSTCTDIYFQHCSLFIYLLYNFCLK